jgi:hypothetical protein
MFRSGCAGRRRFHKMPYFMALNFPELYEAAKGGFFPVIMRFGKFVV